ncbi:unnamed protein product [Calypogeia fissa]
MTLKSASPENIPPDLSPDRETPLTLVSNPNLVTGSFCLIRKRHLTGKLLANLQDWVILCRRSNNGPKRSVSKKLVSKVNEWSATQETRSRAEQLEDIGVNVVILAHSKRDVSLVRQTRYALCEDTPSSPEAPHTYTVAGVDGEFVLVDGALN